MLDGWKTPIGLWAAADAVQRRSGIWEIALIAPILPREAKAWFGKVSDWRETPRRTTQVVRDKSDWRSGNAMELVARNEHLIGASIAYENRIFPMFCRERRIAWRSGGRTWQPLPNEPSRKQRGRMADREGKQPPTQWLQRQARKFYSPYRIHSALRLKAHPIRHCSRLLL
ncbi:MAG: hypothetical protein FJX33_14420 [Alphaproteobacteria bacterium]|nr:hypothetical protein [Alphaproteobacteria bacterium]